MKYLISNNTLVSSFNPTIGKLNINFPEYCLTLQPEQSFISSKGRNQQPHENQIPTPTAREYN